jgi:hypothetical protein
MESTYHQCHKPYKCYESSNMIENFSNFGQIYSAILVFLKIKVQYFPQKIKMADIFKMARTDPLTFSIFEQLLLEPNQKYVVSKFEFQNP